MNERLVCQGAVDSTGRRVVEQMIDAGVLQSAWYAAETSSTNTIGLEQSRTLGAARQSQADAPEPGSRKPAELPRLILADHQTAGRGRHGRVWSSDHSSLTFSIVLPWLFQNDRRSRLLSIAVGLGLARAIEFEFAPLRTSLKWPNDLWISGGKVAGVLLENAGVAHRSVVIGIGINIEGVPDLATQDATPSDGRSASVPPASLSHAIGRRVDRFDALAAVVPSVLDSIARLDQSADEVVDEFRQRCLLSGRMISFQRPGARELNPPGPVGSSQVLTGRCQGIDGEGALQVETAEGPVRVSSGEVAMVRFLGT